MSDGRGTLEAAEQVAEIATARGIDVVVIGAMALAAHGYIRATRDVDLAVNVTVEELRELARSLEMQGHRVEMRMPDADDPLGGVIDITGVFGLVQVINYGGRFPGVIEDALAAQPARVGDGSELRYAPIPQLVALKLYAGGLKSLSDVVALLQANPGADLDAIETLCGRYGLSGFADVRRELAR